MLAILSILNVIRNNRPELAFIWIGHCAKCATNKSHTMFIMLSYCTQFWMSGFYLLRLYYTECQYISTTCFLVTEFCNWPRIYCIMWLCWVKNNRDDELLIFNSVKCWSCNKDVSSSVNPWTDGNAWMHNQHCGYWCPGAKAPGHQYPQCWFSTYCTTQASYKYITFNTNNDENWYFEKKYDPVISGLMFCLPPIINDPCLDDYWLNWGSWTYKVTGHISNQKLFVIQYLNSPWTKWRPFCRRHFQIHFLEWKSMNFYWYFIVICSWGSY